MNQVNQDKEHKPEESALPIGTEALRGAMDTLRRYRAGKAELERRLLEDEDFWRLRHREHMPEQGTGPLKTRSAWLVNVILSKHADAMDAYPEPACLPRAADDEDEAALLSAALPVILQQNDFEKTWSDNWWKKLKTGLAVYGVFWDNDKCGGRGDVAIRRIDPLNLYWEPGVEDLQQSRNLFHVELRDNESLIERWPQLRDRLRGGGFTPIRWPGSEPADPNRQSAVVDWYYKKRAGGRTVLHYAKFVGETLLYSTENEASGIRHQASGDGGYEASGIRDQASGDGGYGLRSVVAADHSGHPRSDKASGIRHQASGDGGYGLRSVVTADHSGHPRSDKASGDGGREAGLYDHGLYPFFADVLFPEEGTPAGFGYVDLCRDAQRQIDLMNDAIVANCIAAATPRWLKRGDDGINEAEYADWTRPFVHVQGSIEDSALRPIPVSPLSGNYLSVLAAKINEMKETSGNRDVNNGGVGGGVTAASAIAAMQESSGKLSRDQIQNSYRCFRQVVYCVISLIRQFYDEPRRLRITGPDGEPAYLRFDGRSLRDPEEAELDIEVSAQRQSSYNRLSANEMALQFFQMGFFNPNLTDQALAALEMMDFKGKQAMRRRIAANADLTRRLAQAEYRLQALVDLISHPQAAAQATGNGQQATGNGQQATGSGGQESGIRDQGSGVRDHARSVVAADHSGHPHPGEAPANGRREKRGSGQQASGKAFPLRGRWPAGPDEVASDAAPGSRGRDRRGGHRPPARGSTLSRKAYDALGRELKKNALAERSRARAAAATQPRR